MQTNRTTAADMALQPRIFPAVTPEDCPIFYRIDGIEYRGIPKFFRPTVTRKQLDAVCTLYTFCGRHTSGLLIRAEAMVYHDFSVTDWIAYFENDTGKPSPIVSDFRITAGEIKGTSPVLEHNNGDTCTPAGYTVTETPLQNGAAISLSPADGTPCCGAGPYMRLSFDGWGVNLAIGFPATWQADFTGTDNGVRLSVGQKRCHMTVLPGETIRTPRIVLQAYTGDAVRGRNAWRKFYFAHILPRENGTPLPPMLCLHVFGDGGPEFTGTTEEHQIAGLKQYIDRGMKPDIWWMDAGWYPCDFNWPQTGTWEHDPARFPDGLGAIGQVCAEQDVRFLLWFEPERVRKHTWLSDHHPEWLLENGSDNALLNLGDPAACDWLIDHVNRKIKEYHIRVYRQDFNFAPAPYWEKYESADRIGAMENLHVQGYLRYWDALLDANPGLWIDSCASGGRRNDLDTMRRAVPLHYTDVGYGNHPIKQKQ
ncbi:MAG: alpha-galactosidase, partial [Eubacteriales bacterium]